MTQLKTQRNDASVEEYLTALDDPRKRDDSFTLLHMMQEITGEEPAMWGDSIIGFGSYDYRYNSGHSGQWFITGFALESATSPSTSCPASTAIRTLWNVSASTRPVSPASISAAFRQSTCPL